MSKYIHQIFYRFQISSNTKVSGVLISTKGQGSVIKVHQRILNSLIKFMEKNHYTKIKEHVGLAYIKEKTGVTMM